jgi:hypothetical protein
VCSFSSHREGTGARKAKDQFSTLPNSPARVELGAQPSILNMAPKPLIWQMGTWELLVPNVKTL